MSIRGRPPANRRYSITAATTESQEVFEHMDTLSEEEFDEDLETAAEEDGEVPLPVCLGGI